MICPDWESLVQHRFRDEDPPAGWDEAVRHSSSCTACRARALTLDPSLLFLQLAGGEARAAAISTSSEELAGMAGRVRSARRAREIERSLGPSGRRRVPAAAAALLVGAGLLIASHGGRVTSSPSAGEASRKALPTIARWSLDELAIPAADASTPPLIESLDRPEARVYQLGQDDDLSLVMIVDESLDV